MVSEYKIEDYLGYLKRVEGYANKVGDRFFPYDSPEGGLKTIGYGYKLKTLEEQNTFEKTGLSEKEVEDLLWHEAQVSLLKAKNYCLSNNAKWTKVDDIENRNECQRSVKTRNNIVQNRLKFLTISVMSFA